MEDRKMLDFIKICRGGVFRKDRERYSKILNIDENWFVAISLEEGSRKKFYVLDDIETLINKFYISDDYINRVKNIMESLGNNKEYVDRIICAYKEKQIHNNYLFNLISKAYNEMEYLDYKKINQ